MLRNRVCSITTCLFHSETKRYTTKYWFIVWKYVFLLHLLNKTQKYYESWVLGTFLKISKINSQQENQSVLIAKISSCKTLRLNIETHQGWHLQYHCPDCSLQYKYIPHYFGLLKYSAYSCHTHFLEGYMESKLLKVGGILQPDSEETHFFLFQQNMSFEVWSLEKLESQKQWKKDVSVSVLLSEPISTYVQKWMQWRKWRKIARGLAIQIGCRKWPLGEWRFRRKWRLIAISAKYVIFAKLATFKRAPLPPHLNLCLRFGD